MGEVAYTTPHCADGVTLVIWEGLVNNDTGAPFMLPARGDRTVQVKGTFNGATMTMQGTLDNASTGQEWDTLSDAQGNDLDIVEADKHIEVIQERSYQIRPAITGGGAATDLDVTLMVGGR